MTKNYFNYIQQTFFPYDQKDLDSFLDRLLRNCNICDLGTIAAGTSSITGEGGSYFYCWLRDASITMIRIQYILDFDKYENILKKYIDFIEFVLSQQNPNGISNFGEPKFNLPDGTIYSDSWARPQNDGPALCALALNIFALNLINNNQIEYVKNKLWNKSGGIINKYIDYIINNYNTFTYDLWEEVGNNAFFWNLSTQHISLISASVIALKFSEYELAAKYIEIANIIKNQLKTNYYNGVSLIEASNREYDVAALYGLLIDYEFNNKFNVSQQIFEPSSYEVAQTVYNLNCIFSEAFPINLQDTTNSIPGILIGRYLGDTYNGGNPWIGSSLNVAYLYYYVAEYINKNGLPSYDSIVMWLKSINVNTVIKNKEEMAKLLFNAGDCIMARIKFHTNGNDNNLYEQINKDTGFMLSSQNLTTNYSGIILVIKFRNKLYKLIME